MRKKTIATLVERKEFTGIEKTEEKTEAKTFPKEGKAQFSKKVAER